MEQEQSWRISGTGLNVVHVDWSVEGTRDIDVVVGWYV